MTKHTQLVERINSTRENAAYLPGVKAPDALTATTDLRAALAADFVFIVVPTPYIEATIGEGLAAALVWP